ncbi:MAG: hypothetical protein ACFFAU_09140 [Candidatus Hodarchaeota archaeon]
MNLLDLLLIGFLTLIGIFEFISNTIVLFTKNFEWAKKIHQLELPKNATEREIRNKVFRMFLLGLGINLSLLMGFINSSILTSCIVFNASLILFMGWLDYWYSRLGYPLLIWTIIGVIYYLFGVFSS